MRIYRKQNVFDAALDRFRWLYDEFDNVVVSISGGKDSTVIANLALMVAEEKGRLPVPMLFIDQEAEWQATIDNVRELMYDPRVEPLWYQMPIRLFNSTSTTDHWLNCWDPEQQDKWIHPRDPVARTENIYGTDRFARLFRRIPAVEYEGQDCCVIGGVRGEESPARMAGLTNDPTWKWATWGHKGGAPNQVTMYPIYDWSYSDVWKAIHDNGWSYNTIYDGMYRMGVPVRQMRVSNVHHETAITCLWWVQELEGETWSRLTQRIAGIDALGKFSRDDYIPKTLPFMFSGWREYRDFLLERMIEDEDAKAKFRAKFDQMDPWYADVIEEQMLKMQVRSIIQQDHEFVLIENWETAPHRFDLRKRKRRAREKAEQ